MSFNEEKDEECTSPPATIIESKDEFVCVIPTSLNNIERQVCDLNKYTEYLFGKVSKELDRITFKLKALHKNVVQLADAFSHKIPNKGLPMQDWKLRKNFSSIFIQAQQVYSSTSLPIQNFERHDANTLIPPLKMTTSYQQDNMASLMMSSDDSVQSCSHYPELLKENVISVNEEQKKEKLTQNKNSDHLSKPKTVPTCQLMKEDVPVDHNIAACGKVPHSYVYQPNEHLSFSTYPFRASNKPPARFIIVHGHPYQLLHGIGDKYDSHPYVIYGTGKGEVVPPPPTVTHKTVAFVSPTAQEAPLSLPDWLALLTASNRSDPPEIIHSAMKSSSPVMETTRVVSPLDCLHTTDKDLPVKPPQAEFITLEPEPFELHEQIQEDITLQGKKQRISPSVSPLVISTDIQSRNSVMDLVDFVSVAQSPRSSVVLSVKSSFAQSPRPSIAKSPVSSPLSKPRSAHRPQNLAIHKSMSSTAPQPRSSTLQKPHHSVPVSSVSSCPKPPVSSNLLPRHALNQLSRYREVQSPRSSVIKSKRHLYSPQAKSSSLNATKLSSLQSSSSFQSSSLITSSKALSLFQYTTVPILSGLKQSQSILPTVTKARKALMEAIRRGVLLRKTKIQYLPKQKMEIAENELAIIHFRRKAMGYNSEKSDSDVEWLEEK